MDKFVERHYWLCIVIAIIIVIGLLAMSSAALTPEQATVLSVGDKVRVSVEWGTGSQRKVYMQGDGVVTAYDPATGQANMKLVDTSEKYKGQTIETKLHYSWITEILEDVTPPDDNKQISELLAKIQELQNEINKLRLQLEIMIKQMNQITEDMKSINSLSYKYSK
jgi:peptidoglycan hydrolase CwlO-like protein